jgi:Divergent InlB B-repeat domain
MSVRRSRSATPSGRPASRFRRGSAILLILVAALGTRGAESAQLLLTWIDNSAGEASFRIERKASSDSSYGELTLQNPGVTSYFDTTVLAGETYCYRVQAYDAVGSSGYSNEACGSAATSLVLTVSLSGTGQGTVSSSPDGISCGTDCAETYSSSTVVTLSAIAESGSTFDGWSGGGCTGTGTCTVMGNTPVTVGAAFNIAPPTFYPLSVAVAGPGKVTSSPTGITCGTDCTEPYTSGANVTLTATPNKGAQFLGWSGACQGTGTCSVTVQAATSVAATFSKSKGRK